MNRLDTFLAYAESHRLVVCAYAASMVVIVGWLDWQLPNISVGFLYLIPVLFSAAALRGGQIVLLAVVCAYLREAYDPLNEAAAGVSPGALNPLRWASGGVGRILVV